MKKNIVFYVSMLLMVFAIPAVAVNYSEDFSSDPGWITDPTVQPPDFYWDEASQTYYTRQRNLSPGYKPSRYAYALLDEPAAGSFEIQWDFMVVSCDWSGGMFFGIYDSQLGDDPAGSQYINVSTAVTDGGHTWGVGVSGVGWVGSLDPSYQTPWSFPSESFDGWYTGKIVYDSDSLDVSVRVITRDSQELIFAAEGTGLDFNKELRYLGSSHTGVGDYGYIGFDPLAVAVGYLDNVSIVPEPASAILIGVGCLFARLWRRRR